MKLPILTCEVCGRQTVIPSRTLTGAELVQPYWPEEEHLSLVCDRCAHLQHFLQDGLAWIETAPPVESRAFWRVEIPCSDPLCRSSIVAHFQTFSKTSRSALGVAIACADPVPVCLLGHRPVPEPYPVLVDFIEWSGGEEYIV